MSKKDKKVSDIDPFADDVLSEADQLENEVVQDVHMANQVDGVVADKQAEPAIDAGVSIAELRSKDDEIARLRDEVLRQQAEFVNLERRHEKALADTTKYSVKKIIEALLPVLDGFNHALTHGEPNDNPEASTIYAGLSMSADILKKVLIKQGIEEINPAVGDDFDPQVHEAITMQKNEEHPSGAVLAVVQPGYRLYDRVVRAARVVVNE